jgi:mannose-1-phosphate guanylyltransferase
LLRSALARAAALVPQERTLVVVASEHESWWSRQLADFPARNIVVQPANRGTAAGVLLPVLEVLERDPRARVAILPSDHAIEDEARFRQALERALARVNGATDALALVGIAPDGPEQEYGWIVPAEPLARGVYRVGSFVEKPAAERADQLFRGGALWSSFALAGRARALASRTARAVPELAGALVHLRGSGADFYAHYARLPLRDFSRDVLQVDARGLEVVEAPRCGWTDLGTVRRVEHWLRAKGELEPGRARACAEHQLEHAFLDLRDCLLRAAGMVPAVG